MLSKRWYAPTSERDLNSTSLHTALTLCDTPSLSTTKTVVATDVTQTSACSGRGRGGGGFGFYGFVGGR
jgi:hypothetical protein